MTELNTAADVADALTNPIRVREPIHYWDEQRNKKVRYHEHTLPSLIRQLHLAVVPGVMYAEDTGGRTTHAPRSVPPARLEAINACLTIDAGAALLVATIGATRRHTTAGNLRALVGASTDSDTATAVLDQMRRWYGLAATVAGWERPPWRPDAPCPLCARRGGLRVRLDRSTAACAECGEAWTPLTIGLLAEHVRQVAEAAAESRRWAPWALRHQSEPGMLDAVAT